MIYKYLHIDINIFISSKILKNEYINIFTQNITITIKNFRGIQMSNIEKVNEILEKRPKVVGIYRLTMKAGSDNFRASAILDIIKGLKANNQKIIIYEPTLKENEYNGCEIVNDLNKFKTESSVIMANRVTNEIRDEKRKIYTRDLFENE